MLVLTVAGLLAGRQGLAAIACRGRGRKRKRDRLTSLVDAVETLVEPDSHGDPESPLRWTIKSLRQITEALRKLGYDVSRRIVSDILHDLGYSLQANKKTVEGIDHPDRDAQFRHINKTVKGFMASGDPVISVDTKKKELVGEYENKGREWHFQGCPEEVQGHDFPDPGTVISAMGAPPRVRGRLRRRGQCRS